MVKNTELNDGFKDFIRGGAIYRNSHDINDINGAIKSAKRYVSQGSQTYLDTVDTNQNLPTLLSEKPQDQKRAIMNMVREAENGGNDNRYVHIAEVTQEESRKLKDITGLDLTGYKHTVNSYGVRHALKRHGNQDKEKLRGQQALTSDDFSRIPEIISALDEISLSGKDAMGND
jgi:hypothetical protein